jgi:hypothetical protein
MNLTFPRQILVLILGAAASLLAAGCNKTIEDFVTGDPGNGTSQPSYSTAHPNGTKVSPGAGQVAGAQLKTQFAITPTQKTVQGTQVKAKFSLHQNRPN